MDRFNGVRRENDSADILWILEKLTEALPVVMPGFDDSRILVVPFVFKLVQLGLGQILAGCKVDMLEVGHEFLLIFRTNVLQGIPNLMHHTKLHFRFREDGLYGFRKALKTVNKGGRQSLSETVEKGQAFFP